jgi:hypothetical protein
MNYDSMTIEQLLAESQRITEERAALRQEQLQVQAALDKKLATQRAAELVATMSDADKAALAQAINGAGGIASGEQVNGF